jgi:hypothetical protein
VASVDQVCAFAVPIVVAVNANGGVRKSMITSCKNSWRLKDGSSNLPLTMVMVVVVVATPSPVSWQCLEMNGHMKRGRFVVEAEGITV